MADTIQYLPFTEKELYDFMILLKRELVTAGLKWTAESPTDPGIAVLKVTAHMGGLLAEYEDSRISQNFLIYAIDNEAVHASCRQIGYKIRGAIASRVVVFITANAMQTIPAGARLTKSLEDGTTITFELVDDVVFPAAGSLYAQALQGETSSSTFVGDNTEYQNFTLSTYPIAYAGSIVLVGSNVCTEVTDFVNSGPDSWHYTVEYDYTGQPTFWFGDGTFGKKPGLGAVVTIAYRICDGTTGNIAPGDMNFVNNYANIISVTNQAPVVTELTENITSGTTTVEVVDTVGFPPSGVAYVDEDSFSYTSIAANIFQGVTGLENAHAAEDEVTFSPSYTYGVDRETNREAKISAIRRNRAKTGASSLLDYDYICSLVPGVARVKSLVNYNIIELQVVPADGGIPSDSLKTSVVTYITPRKGAIHTVNVLNPRYVYIDVVVEVAPGAGHSFTNDVKTPVEEAIQDYFNPLKKDSNSMYWINGWGNLLKKNYLESLLFDLGSGALVSDVEITTFKRSTSLEGNSNIQLALIEIAHIGSILIRPKDVVAPITTGEQMAPIGTMTIPKVGRIIV